MYSNVFHANIPGAIVCVFRGQNHVEDSEEFCAAYGVQGISLKDYGATAKTANKQQE